MGTATGARPAASSTRPGPGTANGFAADLLRYLADEPVLACPPSAAYRFRKFARRNKVRLATVGIVLFFLFLLGGGAGWVLRNRSTRLAIERLRIREGLLHLTGGPGEH